MGIICNPISSFNTFIACYKGKKNLGEPCEFYKPKFFLRCSQAMSYVKQPINKKKKRVMLNKMLGELGKFYKPKNYNLMLLVLINCPLFHSFLKLATYNYPKK